MCAILGVLPKTAHMRSLAAANAHVPRETAAQQPATESGFTPVSDFQRVIGGTGGGHARWPARTRSLAIWASPAAPWRKNSNTAA
eukprot:scaffold185241_cov31-Tisochrysis_lutea.AAC.3